MQGCKGQSCLRKEKRNLQKGAAVRSPFLRDINYFIPPVMERFLAAEEPSLAPVPLLMPVLSVLSVPIVELSLTSGSGMLVSIVGKMVLGIVLGTVGLFVGIVAGALLLQPQAAQAIQRIAAAKIAINLFIVTS